MPGKYTYIIVDENASMKVLIPHLIKDYGDFTCIGDFSTAWDALNYLKKNYCDLMFLSVEMSEMDGFELLDYLDAYFSYQPLTIMTTAKGEKYSDRAHLYYSKGMIDFINKNFDIKRLSVSLERFEKIFKRELFHQNSQKEIPEEILAIGRKKELDNYPISQITHFIHKKNYTYCYLSDGKKYDIYKPLIQIEALLPIGTYIRISRDCIVMLFHVIKYENDHLLINGVTIKMLQVSVRNRNHVIKICKRMNILCE